MSEEATRDSVSVSTGDTDAGSVSVPATTTVEVGTESVTGVSANGDSLESRYSTMPAAKEAEPVEKEEEPVAEAKVEEKTEETEVVEDADYGAIQVPEGVPVDDVFLTKVKALSSEKGISPEALQALVNLNAEHTKAAMAAYEAQIKANVEGLKKELGDKYTRTLDDARVALSRFDTATEDYPHGIVAALFTEVGIDRNPHIIKMLANLQRQTGEDSSVHGGGTAPRAASNFEDRYRKTT